jgi:1,2-diacylglycerol 3-alpha-glucosyltransferase
MKKRILFTSLGYFPKIGGVENSLFYLSQSARKFGVKPLILTDNSGVEKPLRKTEIQKIRNDTVIRYPKTKIILITLLYAIFILRKIKCNVDGVVCRDNVHAAACGFLNIKYCYIVPAISKTQHNDKTYNILKLLNRKLSDALQRKALNKADSIIAFSNNVINQLKDYGISTDVEMLPPGVDASRFTTVSAVQIENIERHLNVPLCKTRYVCVGRLTHEKGIIRAVEAMSYLSKDSQLIIVGEGVELPNIENCIHRLNLEGNVILTGARHDVERYMQISDVLVLPSSYEAFGQVIIEAMASGLKIVGYDNIIGKVKVATPEITTTLNCAFLAQAHTSHSLAEAMKMASKTEIDKMKLSRRVHVEYSWDKFFSRVVEKIGVRTSE